MDLCFNEAFADLPGVIARDMPSEGMRVFPDVLNVGSIADMDPASRLRELIRHGIKPQSNFVEQCKAVVEGLSSTDRLRIWVDAPYQLLPEVLYAASCVKPEAKVTVCELGPGDTNKSINQIVSNAFESEVCIDQGHCAEKWRQLVEENTPLRVAENSRLTSVSEDYFDAALIRAYEDESTVSVKEAVGKVFYSYVRTTGVSFPDDFLAYRLQLLAAARDRF